MLINTLLWALVSGLGHDDFLVRESCQKVLSEWCKSNDDLRHYLPRHHEDAEINSRLKGIRQDYQNIGQLPPLRAFRSEESEYEPFTFRHALITEIALQHEVIKPYDYQKFYYVGKSDAEEYQVVVEFVRRLFEEKGMTREQVRNVLKNAAGENK